MGQKVNIWSSNYYLAILYNLHVQYTKNTPSTYLVYEPQMIKEYKNVFFEQFATMYMYCI